MNLEILPKTMDTIFNNIDSNLYFIRESEDDEKNVRKGPRRVASRCVNSISIEEIKKCLEDDSYALIKFS